MVLTIKTIGRPTNVGVLTDNNGDILKIYPLVNVYIAIENGPVEIVDLPINSMVDVSIVTLVYQRVNLHFPMVFLWFSYGSWGKHRKNSEVNIGKRMDSAGHDHGPRCDGSSHVFTKRWLGWKSHHKWRWMARKISYKWGIFYCHAWLPEVKWLWIPPKDVVLEEVRKKPWFGEPLDGGSICQRKIRIQPEHMTETSVSPRLRMSFYTTLW